ncbi:hypothetical protein E8E12_004564 [Didymella heteroderae]|uniref:Heterokaryon incompatibility domain-containing protein n=1 Tax=Didymella heteroderae TaxID=1769908 RepID=A0A9P5C649_9PLEO|nr:hypothetical protein E8E12_004564 [Didymella heteroderae]
MPQASCNVCIQSIYGTDVQICDCEAAKSKYDCPHWRRHHAEINELCMSARNGCRMCSELWRFFFKEKTPEQYLAGIMPGLDGQGFLVGGSVHLFFGSGTSYRVTEIANRLDERNQALPQRADDQSNAAMLLALDFCINSPMIYEVEERRYVLKKTSDYERLFMLFTSGLLQLDEDSNDESKDLSKKRWEWVRTWMSECADEGRHRLCSRALESIRLSSYLPTRLIEVAPIVKQDRRKYYRLLKTARSLQGRQRYATLSHIWGADQQPLYRTVTDNYEGRLQDGILRDDLPACFQDALDATQKIGIPYIWIDSLCIIQDDDVDCPAEAGRMDQVYSNSSLNLSATASSSSKDRLPSMAKADRLQEPRFVGTVWSGRYSGIYQIFDPDFWSDRVTSTRLASRGWIFQERALAPRVLHFGFDQVLWECAESERAEEFPHGLPLCSTTANRQGFKWDLNTDALQNAAADYGTSTVVRERMQQKQYDVLDRKWSAVISEYSRCELTKPQDKLVAISGVAKVLADRFDDTYIAGLWQSNLVGGLCWRVPKMRRTTQDLIPSGLYARRWEISRRLEGNGAPSWSWASVDGEVEPGPFQNEELENRVHFVLESGPSGYTTCSSLLLGAPRVEIVPKTYKNTFGEVDTERTRLELHGTTYPLELYTLDQEGKYVFRHVGTESPLIVYLDQPEEPDAVEIARFLPLVQIKHYVSAVSAATDDCSTRDRYDLDRVIGILIAQVRGTDVYRRIGLHTCQAKQMNYLLGTVEPICLV